MPANEHDKLTYQRWQTVRFRLLCPAIPYHVSSASASTDLHSHHAIIMQKASGDRDRIDSQTKKLLHILDSCGRRCYTGSSALVLSRLVACPLCRVYHHSLQIFTYYTVLFKWMRNMIIIQQIVRKSSCDVLQHRIVRWHLIQKRIGDQTSVDNKLRINSAFNQKAAVINDLQLQRTANGWTWDNVHLGAHKKLYWINEIK